LLGASSLVQCDHVLGEDLSVVCQEETPVVLRDRHAQFTFKLSNPLLRGRIKRILDHGLHSNIPPLLSRE
jgi:hypothetical protein